MTAVWLHLTAGRGPAECRLALAGVLPELLREADAAGVVAEVIETEADDAGPASALIALRGEGAIPFARGWSGTVQWISPSPLRPHHGRKNWFVGVAVLEPPDAGPSGLDEADVVVETMRASGPGGQHVNRTESAVRATHRPTGIQVVAREERSQHRNRSLALARLAARLAGRGREADAAAARVRWRGHDRLERGNPVRIYEGPSFGRRR